MKAVAMSRLTSRPIFIIFYLQYLYTINGKLWWGKFILHINLFSTSKKTNKFASNE